MRDITNCCCYFDDAWNSGFSSSDDSDLSSDGLVGDSASEYSGIDSDNEDEADEAQLEQAEDSYVQKQTAQSEPAEFSDPEYGYNSEDSENEVRLSYSITFQTESGYRYN